MSTKPKKQYKVFMCHTQYYDGGRIDEWETELGTTYAVSENQAINNVKYRLGIKPRDCYCDTGGDLYSRESDFRAERIIKNATWR